MLSVVIIDILLLIQEMETLLRVSDQKLKLSGARLLSGDDDVVGDHVVLGANRVFEFLGALELVDVQRLLDIFYPEELAGLISKH